MIHIHHRVLFTIQLDEGSANVIKGCWAPLISFNAAMKPIAIDCIFCKTASNTTAGAEIINGARDSNNLGRNQFRYYLSSVIIFIFIYICIIVH